MKRYKRKFEEDLDREDIGAFISVVNQIINKLSNMDDDKLDKFQNLLMDKIENNLDKYLVNAIDGIIGRMKKFSPSNFDIIERALEQGHRYEGTEERTALIAAIDYLNIVLRKM